VVRPKQRMTLEQYYKIIGWLKEHKHQIHGSNDTQPEICLQAESALGFIVPITSIQKCGKIAKIKWPKSPTPPPLVPLEREAIIILMGAIAGLYVETGKTVPNELANLQSIYVRQQPDDAGDYGREYGHTLTD